MCRLQDIVPPLELCKLIPAGEFEDSAMYWGDLFGVADVFPRKCGDCDTFGVIQTERYIFPAPTLQEILEELHKHQEDVFLKWSEYAYHEWLINAYSHGRNEDYQEHDKNIATAALKVWLQMKGIQA